MDNSAENTENKDVTPATEEISANAENQPSLAEAVQESKDAISSAEPVKRRGRPKKDANAPAKEKSKKEAEAKASAPVAPSIPPTFLKPVVNFPFQAAALKSGWPGWNLSDKEQEDNAVLLDLVIKRYAPQFQTEHPELFALAIGLGMAGVARFFAFRELLIRAQAEQARNIEANGGVPEPKPGSKRDKLEKNKNSETGVKPGSGLADFLNNGPQNTPQI